MSLMTRTPYVVLETATEAPNEVLVAYSTDRPTAPIWNVTLTNATALKATLIANPPGSPGRAAAEASAYAAGDALWAGLADNVKQTISDAT